MKVAYEAAFLRDLKRARSKKVRRWVHRVIEEVKKASAVWRNFVVMRLSIAFVLEITG